MSDRLPGCFDGGAARYAGKTGTMVQPLELFDTITGLDFPQFSKMSGGFRFLQGGLPVQDTDIIVDGPYANEKHLQVEAPLT